MRDKFKRAIVLSVAACGIALAGCWHRETPQQKFVDAMSHGNSAQASQIWLHMNAKNRADFEHSQGMQPNTSADDVKNQFMQHYQDKMGGDDDSDNNGESVEKPAPSVHLGGLESLPEWRGPTGEPPQAVTVPTQNEPSN